MGAFNYNKELNFVRKFDKSIPVPSIIYVDDWHCPASYHPPENNLYYKDLNNKTHSAENGCIIVNANEGSEFIVSISHEWRHHWQFCKNPIVFNQVAKKQQHIYTTYEDDCELYENGIVTHEYITNSYKRYAMLPLEIDAIMFSCRYGYSFNNSRTIEILGFENMFQFKS